MSLQTKINPALSEKANLVLALNNYLNTVFPGLNSAFTESDVEFGTPQTVQLPSDFYTGVETTGGVNAKIAPNTEVSVTITKEGYIGPTVSVLKYYRHDFANVLGKLFESKEDFLKEYTNFVDAGINVDSSGESAFKARLATFTPIVDTSITVTFNDNPVNSVKSFKITPIENSLLYTPTAVGLKAEGDDSQPWIVTY